MDLDECIHNDCIFVDRFGDVYMPNIMLSLNVIFFLATSLGYRAVKYANWLRRNDASEQVSKTAQMPTNVSFRTATQPLQRQSAPLRGSPPGSPRRRSQGELGVNGGVTKGYRKLRLQRIPRHRFSRSAILDMVNVPGVPVVRMSMQGRREVSDVPSAEVSFASPEDCNRVYGEVKSSLERDGIWVSQA